MTTLLTTLRWPFNFKFHTVIRWFTDGLDLPKFHGRIWTWMTGLHHVHNLGMHRKIPHSFCINGHMLLKTPSPNMLLLKANLSRNDVMVGPLDYNQHNKHKPHQHAVQAEREKPV